MDELLRKRIDRALEGLPDDKVMQVLDYIQFLQSKYGDRTVQPSALERIADGVEDTLRVGRVPIAAIKGTREVLNTAERVMKGLAEAGRTVVDEIQGQLQSPANESDQPAGDAAQEETSGG